MDGMIEFGIIDTIKLIEMHEEAFKIAFNELREDEKKIAMEDLSGDISEEQKEILQQAINRFAAYIGGIESLLTKIIPRLSASTEKIIRAAPLVLSVYPFINRIHSDRENPPLSFREDDQKGRAIHTKFIISREELHPFLRNHETEFIEHIPKDSNGNFIVDFCPSLCHEEILFNLKRLKRLAN